MVVVQKQKGDTKDSIFRKFSKIFIEENVVNELKKHLFYKKPSLVKREEEKERILKRKQMKS